MTLRDDASKRPRLVWHKDGVVVYLANTGWIGALLAWSVLTDPGARSHSAAAVIGGSAAVIGLAWCISFLLAGLPFHRPAKANPEDLSAGLSGGL